MHFDKWQKGLALGIKGSSLFIELEVVGGWEEIPLKTVLPDTGLSTLEISWVMILLLDFVDRKLWS